MCSVQLCNALRSFNFILLQDMFSICKSHTLNYIRSEMIDPQGFSGEGSEVVLVSL